jgi:hypothetical protein
VRSKQAAAPAWLIGMLMTGSLSAQTSRYVAPGGASSNPGTEKSPWTLGFAVSGAGGRIQPGDTIWVKGGTYRGEVIITMSGTKSQPVILRAAPGQRATVEGDVAVLREGHVWIWGLEIRGSTRPSEAFGVNVRAPGVRLINLVVHGAGLGGVGQWLEGSDGEVYGSLIYGNGTRQSHHGIAVQNTSGTKRLEDNLVWENAGYGFHISSTEEERVRNVIVRGNFAWSNGGKSPLPDYYVGGESVASAIVIDTNASWSANRKLVTAELGSSSGAANRDLTYRGNYLVGAVSVPAQRWSQISESGNMVVGASIPDKTVAIVRRNRYERARANIGVWNWSKGKFVRLEVPGMDAWQLKDAKDFFGPPVATGTGPGVTVPMNGAEFRAFVLLPR